MDPIGRGRLATVLSDVSRTVRAVGDDPTDPIYHVDGGWRHPHRARPRGGARGRRSSPGPPHAKNPVRSRLSKGARSTASLRPLPPAAQPARLRNTWRVLRPTTALRSSQRCPSPAGVLESSLWAGRDPSAIRASRFGFCTQIALGVYCGSFDWVRLDVKAHGKLLRNNHQIANTVRDPRASHTISQSAGITDEALVPNANQGELDHGDWTGV